MTTHDEHDGKAVLHLSGDINVACSAELKQLLVQAFAKGKAVQLDFSAAETLDIAAIQLFWAASRHAEKTGKTLSVVGTVPDAIRNDVRDAGFDNFPVPLGNTSDTETVTTQAE